MTKTKNQKEKKRFYIYKDNKDNNNFVYLVNKVEKDNLEYHTEIPFHPLALNEFMVNHNISYGERFFYCYKFFKYSIES